MTEQNRRLPPEIVEEILIRLPVKSLSRFCCVSRSWQSLISEQTFVRKHFNLSQKTLFFINPFSSDSDKFCAFHLPTLQRNLNINKIYFPLDYWERLSSCDGLLCMRLYKAVYVLNPSVRSYCRIIPNSTDLLPCYYGLGYDSISDDYKLLRLTRTGPGSLIQTEIYFLKVDLWIKFDNFPLDYIPCCGGVFLNGSIHWLALRAGSRVNIFSLFAFDLSDYKYKTTTFPELFSPIPRSDVHATLYVLNGMLCILALLKPWVVLWVMKDVSDPKSWTKVLNIRIQEAFDLKLPKVTPFYLYEDDQVLLGMLSNHGTELLVCKDNTVLFRDIIFKEQSLIHFGFVHVESLISPMPNKWRRVKLRLS